MDLVVGDVVNRWFWTHENKWEQFNDESSLFIGFMKQWDPKIKSGDMDKNDGASGTQLSNTPPPNNTLQQDPVDKESLISDKDEGGATENQFSATEKGSSSEDDCTEVKSEPLNKSPTAAVSQGDDEDSSKPDYTSSVE